MRPKPYAFIAVLFLLSGLAFAINYADYYYTSESDVTVTTEDFTLDGAAYSLVSFDGDPTFLLRGGEIVSDSSTISQVIHDYYAQSYYPSEDDLDELKALVERYNESRNDGYDWKDKEEKACREVLFTDKRIEVYIEGKMEKLWCHDEASCDINAKLLYQAYHEYTGWGSYEPALEIVVPFAYASYGTDDIIANMSKKLNNANEDNIAGALQYIADSVPKLRDYLEDIETTLFRTPRMDDEEDRDDCYLKCYALCPSFDLDEDALDDLETKAESLLDTIEPLAGYAETASSVYDNTVARLENYETGQEAEDYYDMFADIEEEGVEVEEYAQEVEELVSNTSFSMKVDSLIELHTEILDKIDSRNFEGLEDDIADYENLTESVKESADELYAVYNESLVAKNGAERILFEVGTKDLGPVAMEKYEELKEEIAELNAEFGDGLTPAMYEELEAEYHNLSSEAAALLGSRESSGLSQAMVQFRGFARKVNDGLAEFAARTNITNVEQIPENKYFTFGGFSLLVFLSLSSILLLVFLYLVKVHNYSKIKYVVLTGFVLGLIFIALFSGFLYLFLQKTSLDATMEEFLVDFSDRNNVAIAVDSTIATETEKRAMSSCAASMAESMKEANRTVAVYYFEGGNCRKVADSRESLMSEDDCIAEIEGADSAFYLNPSPTTEIPRLYAIYFSKAEIYGTSDYYSSCPLSTIFK